MKPTRLSPFLLTILLAVPALQAQWSGFYSDRPTYRPGESVEIHGASQQGSEVIFRLSRIAAETTELVRSPTIVLDPVASPLGSFVEFPSLDLEGRTALTLEGWILPTLVGGDTVVVAGQLGLSTAGAALLITEEGHAAAYVSDSPTYDPARLLSAGGVLRLDVWHHLAATYDGAELRLYVDGALAATRSAAGPVAAASSPFRLGARSEAPGDLAGIVDGRLDSWTVWPRALAAAEIAARRDRGLNEIDPAPDPGEVLLYVGFDDPYGVVSDRSAFEHPGAIVNHGVPRITGVRTDSLAIGLYHDLVVDAGWPIVASFKLPPQTPSGLYSLQSLTGPDFLDGPEQVIVVEPAAPTPAARIAVLVPVNTWVAYNAWPAAGFIVKEPTPGITSRRRSPLAPPDALVHGGNNSAYGVRGDGVTPGWFQGWRRPNPKADPSRADSLGYSVRAANTRYMVEWLSAQGIPFDLYSDWNLERRPVPAGAYPVWIYHSHQEYWSQQMLHQATSHLDAGASIVSIAGNVLTWRVAHGDGEIMEVRKIPDAPTLGLWDGISAIDGRPIGNFLALAICSRRNDALLMSTVPHMVAACEPNPECFGRWTAANVDHWLWQDSGVENGDEFGVSPVPGVFTVGHEADSQPPTLLPPGLLAGTTPVVLAQGGGFLTPLPRLVDLDLVEDLTCQEVLDNPDLVFPGDENSLAGQISYYDHEAGGHVLSVGSTASPWALASDSTLSGLVLRALGAFAYGDPQALTDR